MLLLRLYQQTLDSCPTSNSWHYPTICSPEHCPPSLPCFRNCGSWLSGQTKLSVPYRKRFTWQIIPPFKHWYLVIMILQGRLALILESSPRYRICIFLVSIWREPSRRKLDCFPIWPRFILTEPTWQDPYHRNCVRCEEISSPSSKLTARWFRREKFPWNAPSVVALNVAIEKVELAMNLRNLPTRTYLHT